MRQYRHRLPYPYTYRLLPLDDAGLSDTCIAYHKDLDHGRCLHEEMQLWRIRKISESSRTNARHWHARGSFALRGKKKKCASQPATVSPQIGAYLRVSDRTTYRDLLSMSGELLRRGATFGDVEIIKNLLEQGSNPCSTDVSSETKTAKQYRRLSGPSKKFFCGC